MRRVPALRDHARRWRLAPPLALALLGVACGGPAPRVKPHGLDVEALASTPHGTPLRIGRSLEPGTRTAQTDVSWTISEAGKAPREGRATIRLEQVTRRTAEGLRSILTVAIVDPEGEARLLVRGLDGLRVTYDQDGDGRIRRPTLRFLTPAPPNARYFLDGLWLAGFGTGRPWVPPHPVREGETWAREALGGLEQAKRMGLEEMPAPEARGGARLEAVDAGEAGGSRGERAHLVLEALVSIDGTIRQGARRAAMSQGVLDRGRATVDVESGLPRTWRYEQQTRFHYDDGEQRRNVEIVQRVEGRMLGADPEGEARDG